jgi:hypothetical protein
VGFAFMQNMARAVTASPLISELFDNKSQCLRP